MRNKCFIAAAFLLLFSAALVAAEADDDYGFIPDINSDRDMAIAPTSSQPFIFSYGGWILPVIVSDTTNTGTVSASMNMVKIWTRMTLGDGSYIYVRGKDLYIRYLSGYYGDKKNDNTADLDVGFIEGSFFKKAMVIDAGRKFFTVGSGLVLNDRGDGMSFAFNNRILNVSMFGMYTGLLRKEDNPYVTSGQDDIDGTKKIFSGLTLDKSFSNQTAYLFSVFESDRQKEDLLNKRYNTQYLGLGIKGVPLDGLDYQLEGIYQTGKSYSGTTYKKEKISAYAGYFTANYYIDAKIKPSFNVTYVVVSGDKDNKGAVYVGTGNASGNDTTFAAFGGVSTGLGYRPSLINIHVIRAGYSFMPFAGISSDRIRRTSFGLKYSYFMKDKPEASTSDPLAYKPERSLGQSFDLTYRWKIFSDLSVVGQYGVFLPGSAYSSDAKNRQTAMFGMLVEF
jgi:hypothetical protein